MRAKVFVSLFCVLIMCIGWASGSPFLVLHFDEGTGNIARDSSGNGYDGSINGATWVKGISGNALRYDGVNDFVALPTLATISDEYTIIAWIKTSSSGFQSIIGGGDTFVEKYQPNLGISYNTTNKVAGCVNRWGAYLASAENMNDGIWHQVVFSARKVDATTANMKIYVDGQLSGEITDPFPVQPWAQFIYIGKRADEHFFNGAIDEVEVYSSALSDSDILSNYNRIMASAGSEEIILHFDEGSGDIAYDSSGNGHDGTIYGSAHQLPWPEGISGKGLDFKGADYVDLGNLGLSNSQGTIEAWIYPRSVQCCEQIFSARDASLHNDMQFYLTTNSKLGFWVWKNDQSTVNLLTPIQSNTWYHVAVTHDGASTKLFVNGTLMGSATNNDWFDDLPGLNKYTIGYLDRYLSNYHFNGIIDEVSVYNRALTAAEIKARYDAIIKAPSISITSPTGGESWHKGTLQKIEWTFTGNPGSDIRIELYKSGAPVSVIAETPIDSSPFSWTPNPPAIFPPNDYQIKITSTTDPTINSMSGFFSIPLPSVSVISPNGGETWQQGVVETIQWKNSGNPVTKAKIELINSTGIASMIYDDIEIGKTEYESFFWEIPRDQPSGSDYQVKITSKTDPAITDISDQTFTIKLPAKFDWRDYNVMTPVEDQQLWPLCGIFSTTGSVEAKYNIEKGKQMNLDLSEWDIYFQRWVLAGKPAMSGFGVPPIWAYYTVEQNGVTDESCTNIWWTFGPDSPFNKKSWNRCSDYANHMYKIDQYYYEQYDVPPRSPPPVDEIKLKIYKEGPITAGFHNFVLKRDGTNGDHGVVLVGWDDSEKVWIIKNSMGTSWEMGVNGYGKIPYSPSDEKYKLFELAWSNGVHKVI